VRIKHLQLVTQKHSVTVTKTLTAYSPFGPVRAGLTTSQITNEARLTELLSSLESVVANLVSKSSTVLDTLTTATKEMLAEPLPSTIDADGIDARI
jgi:hypothetical protein